ncbi:G2/mitotic-specific cyclin [Basidiobolus ranarum]|uniref:G2/mitotic-specific cyclin n=1 Tax=Basidiobolus ranarum TaxID=34480 RepID=A0ABR2W9D0_9FUNG
MNLRRTTTDENSVGVGKPLLSKNATKLQAIKSNSTNPTGLKTKLVNKGGVARKRSALGDVSNVLAPQAQNAGLKKKSTLVARKATETKPASTLIPKKRASQTVEVTIPTGENPLKKVAGDHKMIMEEFLECSPMAIDEPMAEQMEEEQGMLAQDWDDLDAEDEFDPLMVSEYVVEIFEYLRELEPQYQPNHNYMDNQKGLAWKMRSILVDWLVEVHDKFRLLPETLFFAINIIDRFLSQRVVSLVKLQLVGITSMLIAAKVEEIMCPSIENFIYMADGGYTEEEVKKAERYILQVLEWNMSYPNPLNFLRRISKADDYDVQTRTIAKYLMEVALIDHRFLEYPPSQISAAGLFLARHMLNRGEWNANLVHYSGYTQEQIMPVVEILMDNLSKPMKYEAIFKKYAGKKFMRISLTVKDWISKNVSY